MARNLNSRCRRPSTRDPGSSGGGRPAADFGPELSIFRLVPSPNSQALPLAVRCGAPLGPDHPVTASFAESLSAILGNGELGPFNVPVDYLLLVPGPTLCEELQL